jgi:hypothetical protein
MSHVPRPVPDHTRSAEYPAHQSDKDISDKPPWARNIDRLTAENASGIDTRHRKCLESMLAVEEIISTPTSPRPSRAWRRGCVPGGRSLSGAAPAQRGFLVGFIHPVDRVPQPGLGGPLAYKAVRTRTHKYVKYINEESELYDLEADPYKLQSIHETADPSLVAA